MKTTNLDLLHQPEATESKDLYVTNVIDAETLTKTQKLLDSAIISARNAVKSKRKPPILTPTRWVWRLAGYYHLSYCTPRLMEKAHERFASANRQILVQWAAHKAKEEAGHYLLALRDIQSMGYRAEAVVEVLFPPDSKALWNYFTQSVQDSAIDCIGYSYTAERLAMCLGEVYIQKVEALLPPGINATRYLRAHSAVSTTEIEHVKENLAIIAGLTPEERDRVVKACYEVASLCFNAPQQADIDISDEEIESVLKPLKLNSSCN